MHLFDIAADFVGTFADAQRDSKRSIRLALSGAAATFVISGRSASFWHRHSLWLSFPLRGRRGSEGVVDAACERTLIPSSTFPLKLRGTRGAEGELTRPSGKDARGSRERSPDGDCRLRNA